MAALPDLMLQAFDKALDIMLIMEADFDDVGNSKIIYANQAASDILGYSNAEIVGNSPRMFQGNETDKLTRMEIRVSLKQHKPLRSKILNFTKQGDPVWLDIHIIPLLNDAGEVTHFFASERVSVEH
ncbi:MAG: PAS domain-containing protein [Gammaproteobacteria bacterium]|nr:PAS domain-containing protein [Gammaproteobacteria bacterium]NVK86734.1 PAS domain-containing protein [Gammaproteobacteria bacterium]